MLEDLANNISALNKQKKDAGDLEILRQVVRQQNEEIEFLKRIISKLV